MAREYKKTLWVNEETPLNASNLNKIEEGIEGNTNDLAAHEADIAKIDEALKQTKIDLAETKETFENFKEETNNILDNINPDAFKSVFDVENSDDYDNNKVIYEVPRLYKGTLPCDTVCAVPVETINITWLDNDTTLGLILLALMVDGSIYSPDNFCWPNADPQSFEDSFNIFTFNNGEEGLELYYSYDEENGPYVELYLFTLEYNGVIWDSNNGWNRSSCDSINIYGDVEFDSGSKLFGDLLSNIISLNGWPDWDEGRDYYVLGYNGWVKLNGCDTIGITPSIQNLYNIELVDDIYNTQILEVPYMFKGKFNFPFNVNRDYDTLVNVEKVYINKQLDKEIVNNLLAYALLVDDYIISVAPFTIQKYKDVDSNAIYFLDYYKEDEGENNYYSLILTYDESNGELKLGYYTPSVGDWTLYDSNTGWLDDCPDYIEFNHGMAPFESSLFFAILSNIFSLEPFEQKEDLYPVGCDYFVSSNDCWWQKLNGGESTSNSSGEANSSDIKDVESIEVSTISPLPLSGYVDKVYINTSLSLEELIQEMQKLPAPNNELGTVLLIGPNEMGTPPSVGISAMYMQQGENYLVALIDIGILATAQNAPQEEVLALLNSSFIFYHDPAGLLGLPILFDGWNPDFNGEVIINSEVVDTLNSNPVQYVYDTPEEIINLIYTKTSSDDVDTKTIYRMPAANGDYTYHQIKNGECEYFGGNIIPVNKLSDVEKISGTPITKCEDAGPVEIYINKTLTNEQIQELCSKVYYDNGGIYYVCGHDSCMGYLMISDNSLQPTSVQGDIQHNYQIFAYDRNTGNYTDIWSTYDGWYDSCPDSIILDTNSVGEMSIEPLSEEDAFEFVGKYNDLIKDLLSATPLAFNIDKKAIYRVKEDNPPKVTKSAVPTGGSGKSIGKIFINLNLSNEEMLELFKSVTYAGASNDYKFHNVIHSVGKEEDSNWGFVETYNLHIIKQNDTEYELTLTEWVIESGNRYYNRVCLYSTIDGWNPDISNYVNADGSLREDIAGTKAFEYVWCTFGDVGLENDKLINLIYNQTIEDTDDYAYYQYTSNGWERYGVGVIPVKKLPSAEAPSEYIPVPNEGEITYVRYNKPTGAEVKAILDTLPDEAFDENGTYYIYIIGYKDDSGELYKDSIELYVSKHSEGGYYITAQEGSSWYTLFDSNDTSSRYTDGWWNNFDDDYDIPMNSLVANGTTNRFLISEFQDGDTLYRAGQYNHLLTNLFYCDNPEYDPNYKPTISQTVLYRVDANGKSKYYNFNGIKWNEVGSGSGGGMSEEDMELIQKDMDAISKEVSKKQNKLTAGTGIVISEDGTISLAYPFAEEEEY